jgi:hypothetical protein
MFLSSNTPNDYHMYGPVPPSPFEKDYERMETYSLNAMVSNSLLYHWANKRSDFDDLLMDDMAPLSRSDLISSKAAQAPTKATKGIGNVTPAQRYKSAKKVKAPKMVLPSAPAVRIDIASTGLNEYDVVCGRSRMAHTHPGNKHFRRLVKEYSFAYQNAKAREEKKRITLSIIAAIESLGGRFLKFEGNDDEDEPFGDVFEADTVASAASLICTEASAEYQYEKVSHALRSSCKSPRQLRRRSSTTSTSTMDSTSTTGSANASIVSWPDERLEDYAASFAQSHLSSLAMRPLTVPSYIPSLAYNEAPVSPLEHRQPLQLQFHPHQQGQEHSPLRHAVSLSQEEHGEDYVSDLLDCEILEPIADGDEADLQDIDPSLLFRLL